MAPVNSWVAWDKSTATLTAFRTGQWTEIVPEFQDLTGIGVGASNAVDATNRLAVSSDATLLTHTGARHQLKVNKSGAAEAATLLFNPIGPGTRKWALWAAMTPASKCPRTGWHGPIR